MNVVFGVPGPPVPMERHRSSGGRNYLPRKSKRYQDLVAACAQAAFSKLRERWPTDAEYGLEIHVYWPDKRRRDIDNVAKQVLDALNKIAWDDDCQVWHLVVSRRIDKDKPRMLVGIQVSEPTAAVSDIEASQSPRPAARLPHVQTPTG